MAVAVVASMVMFVSWATEKNKPFVRLTTAGKAGTGTAKKRRFLKTKAQPHRDIQADNSP